MWYNDSAILSPSNTSPRLSDLWCTWRRSVKRWGEKAAWSIIAHTALKQSRHSKANWNYSTTILWWIIYYDCCKVGWYTVRQTDLLRPANGQGVVVIRLVGVMIGADFVDIESHIVPLLVARYAAREQAQDQDAVQPHCLLAATRQVSNSALHDLLQRWRMHQEQEGFKK